MAVISMASTKGGAGKTTTALALSHTYADMGFSVALLDNDPNQPLFDWSKDRHKGGKKSYVIEAREYADNQNRGSTTSLTLIEEKKIKPSPGRVDCYPPEDDNELLDVITALDQAYDMVIVDNEGTQNLAMSYCFMASNFIIIPCGPATLEFKEAVKVIRFIKQTSKGTGRNIPFRFLFVRTPSAIRTKTLKEIEYGCWRANMPWLENRISERAAFERCFAVQKHLYELTSEDVTDPTSLIDDVEAVANEIADILASDDKKEIGYTLHMPISDARLNEFKALEAKLASQAEKDSKGGTEAQGEG